MGKGQEITFGRPSQRGAQVHGVGINDIVTEHGVAGKRKVHPAGRGLDAVLTVRMGHGHEARLQSESLDPIEQIQGAGGPGIMAGLEGLGHGPAQIIFAEDRKAFPLDQGPDGLAVAQSLERPDGEGQIDIKTGLLPDSEFSLGHVFPYVFARGPLVGEFPIMNNPGPVRGQVGDQVFLHQTDNDRRQSVFYGVRAEGQNNRPIFLSGLFDIFGRPVDQGRHLPAQRGGLPVRWNMVPLDYDLIGSFG